jgi:riboflavin synthase
MFSGIVAAVGKVRAVRSAAGGLRLRVDAGGLDLGDVAIGDSIAVNGVCLTVVALGGGGFEADVSEETLRCTAGFPALARVNLEKALRLADRLGGHLVSGHVDGVGAVARVAARGDNRLLAVTAPRDLARYVARKGSIAVNGVSLTVNEVGGARFEVNLIPHTLVATNLGDLKTGDRVNLEIDQMARYAERLSEASASGAKPKKKQPRGRAR